MTPHINTPINNFLRILFFKNKANTVPIIQPIKPKGIPKNKYNNCNKIN